MKTLYRNLAPAIFLLCSFSTQASVISSQGSFAVDDEVRLFNFSFTADYLFSARTGSFVAA